MANKNLEGVLLQLLASATELNRAMVANARNTATLADAIASMAKRLSELENRTKAIERAVVKN